MADAPVTKRRRMVDNYTNADAVHCLPLTRSKPSRTRHSAVPKKKVDRPTATVDSTPSPMREMSIDVWRMINPMLSHREIGHLRCTGDVKIRAAVSRFTEITHLLKGRHPKTENHLYPIMTLVGVENPKVPCFPFLRKLVLSHPFHSVRCSGCGGAYCSAHCKFPENAVFPALEDLHIDDNVVCDWASDGFKFGAETLTPMFPRLKTMVVLLHKRGSYSAGAWQSWVDIFLNLQLPLSVEHLEFKTNPFEPSASATCYLWERSVSLMSPGLNGRWHEWYDDCKWNVFALLPRGLRTLLIPRFGIPLRALSNLPSQLEHLRVGWIDGSPRSNTCVCSLYNDQQIHAKVEALPTTLRTLKYVPNEYRGGTDLEQTVLETLQVLTGKVGCKLVQETSTDQYTC